MKIIENSDRARKERDNEIKQMKEMIEEERRKSLVDEAKIRQL